MGLAIAALLASVAVVWGRGQDHHSRPHPKRRPAHAGQRPKISKTATTNPATGGPVTTKPSDKIQHVVWIFMENHGYDDIIGSSQAPYINSLATMYGLATNYFAVSHPSLPNYIAATSGATQGITDDNGPSSDAVNAPSIFSQLPPGASRSLEEGMPANCLHSDSGGYVVHHNPEAYFANMGAACSSYDVPFGSAPNLSAAFTFVTPNLIDDMHDGTIADGDNFLRRYVPALLASPQYQAGKTVIFITWDEDRGPCSGCTNRVPLIVISPYTHHVRDGMLYSHYSLLRTSEELLGLPLLRNAASARSMLGKFGF